MSAAKVWWFRVRLCAAFPLMLLLTVIVYADLCHLQDAARVLREMWKDGEP